MMGKLFLFCYHSQNIGSYNFETNASNLNKSMNVEILAMNVIQFFQFAIFNTY